MVYLVLSLFICFIFTDFIYSLFSLNFILNPWLSLLYLSTLLKYLIPADCVLFMSRALIVKDSFHITKSLVLLLYKILNFISFLVLVFKILAKSTSVLVRQ
jgi:hypothetical protein